MRSFPLLFALLLTMPMLCSQEIRLFGELVQQAGTLRLATPDVVLLAGSTALANEVGQVVEVRGTLVAGSMTPTVAVTFAQRSDHTFELNGGLRIGHTSQLRVESSTAITYYLVGSLAPGFLPLAGIPFANGTVFVALPTVLIHGGPLNGVWQEPFVVPNQPGLLGVEVWFQAAIFDGTFVYVNAQHGIVTS